MTAIGSPTIEVTVGHGTGTLSVTRADGTPLTQTTGKAPLGNLLIIYKAAGRMMTGGQVTVNVPEGWQTFRDDNGDTVATPGEVSLTGKATLDLPTITSQAIANINAEMKAGDELRFLYKNVTVPDVASGTATFAAKASAFGGAELAPADPDNIVHNIGIGRAADGGGTLAIAPADADAGSTIDITLTYTAEGAMIAGSQVKVTLPTNGSWPSPVGKTSVSTGTLSTDATTMTATTSTDLAANDTIVFTYSGVQVPDFAGRYEFTAQSKAHPTDGTLRGLSAGATIEIDEVAAGLIALMNAMGEAVTIASPGMALGNLSFVFTAEEDMTAGAQVTVQIMNGWSPPFRGNNAADSRSGAVWADGATLGIDPAADQAGPWTITATLDAAIDVGGSLTITYMAVDAPTAEAVYGFATRASLVSGGTLLEVSPSPSVTVREPITALAASVDNASVFVDESIVLTVTLWDADGEGAATGSMVIALDDGDAGGTFDPASITIGNTGHSGMSTYTNDTAGEITLTASSGDLDPVEVPVEVKSGITGKSVDPDPSSAGADVMISATGGAEAAATLKLSYTNADGNTVTINKGLDPVGDPVDGSQQYTRMITLPSDIPEGDHMVTLTIAGRSDSVSFEVLNDQTPPTLSDARILPTTVANGTLLTLTVKASSSSESNPVESVMADVSAVDNDSTEVDTTMIPLTKQAGTDNTYFAIHTVSMDNTNDDGVVTVTFTATDQIGGKGTDTASVTLANDVTAPELSDESADPPLATNGTEVTISVSSESGLTVTADASAIGGGMVTLTEGTVDDGMDANGNGNGMDANGNGNGMDANGNGNGDNGNGNGDNGMTDTAMPAGNGVYTGMVTVTNAEAGEQTITITATDSSGNESTVDVTVTIEVMEPIAPVTAIAVVADPTNVFAGEDIAVSVTLWSGAEEGAASAAMVINLSDGDAGGSFSDADGNAITSVTIAVGGFDASPTYSNDSAGEFTLTATVADEESELEPATVEVTVKAFISNFQVNGTGELGPLTAGVTITVSATGKEGKATVTVTDADGEPVVPSKGLTGLDEEPDEEGNVDYTRDIDLPADLTDGIYTVTVTIAGEDAAMAIEIINDQSTPALSNQKVLPDTVAIGSVIALSIDVTSNVPNPRVVSDGGCQRD